MRDITLRDPIAKHPLNVGRVAWWLGLPGLTGGPKWFDLMGLSHAAYSVTTPPSLGAWSPTARPGGYAQANFASNRWTTPSAPRLDCPAGLTLSSWVNPNATQGIHAEIFRRNNSYLFRFDGSLVPVAYIWNTVGFTSLAAASAIPAAKWSMATVTWDHVNISLYVNGILSASVAKTGTAPTGSSALVIGDSETANAEPFSGSLDDVAVWNRSLSAAQIFQLYTLSQQGYPGVLNRESRTIVAFGSGTAYSSALPSILSSEQFGAMTAAGVIGSALPAVLSAEFFGSTTSTAAITATLPAIASAEFFGSTTIAATITATLPAIASAEFFGAISSSSGQVLASALPSILSAESFGAITASQTTGAPDPGVYPDWTQSSFLYL
jgi:hypothetical protein